MSRFISSKNLIKLFLDIRLTRSSTLALFISTTKSFKLVSRDTIARWIMNTIKKANIATDLFTATTKKLSKLDKGQRQHF